MKSVCILLALICITMPSYAQIVNKSSDSQEFERMINSKLTVVLIGEAEYDRKLMSAVSKYWKITPFDSISIKDINTVIQDESRSFFLPLYFGVTFDFDHGGTGSKFSKTKSWFSIINGGKKKINKYGDNDAICIAPIGYYSSEDKFSDCTYRLEYIIKGLNDGVEIARKEKLTGNMAKMPFNTMDEISKNKKSVLNKKTLAINKEMKNSFGYDIASESSFEKNYTYKYKFVSDEEFRSILSGNSEEYLCLMPVIEVNKHILIYEPSTKKTVFYGWSMQGLKVTKKDIKNIVE